MIVNDLNFRMSKTDFLNFTYYNTISAPKILRKTYSPLKQETSAAVEWFKVNEIIANPGKFQVIGVREN